MQLTQPVFMQFSLPRFGVAILISVLVTFAVFLLMQSLIISGMSAQDKDSDIKMIEFIDISRDDAVRTKDNKLTKPPTSTVAPPSPDMPVMGSSTDTANSSSSYDTSSFGMETTQLGGELQADSGLSGANNSDGDYLPIVKIAPQYPRIAAQKGIEGYVVLEFTVTALGTVADVKVIEADPENIFDQAAISAANKFKYKPKIVDGKPMDVNGVRNIIRFELERN